MPAQSPASSLSSSRPPPSLGAAYGFSTRLLPPISTHLPFFPRTCQIKPHEDSGHSPTPNLLGSARPYRRLYCLAGIHRPSSYRPHHPLPLHTHYPQGQHVFTRCLRSLHLPAFPYISPFTYNTPFPLPPPSHKCCSPQRQCHFLLISPREAGFHGASAGRPFISGVCELCSVH